MPRAKRQLAETDGNASDAPKVPRASKRTKAAKKENQDTSAVAQPPKNNAKASNKVVEKERDTNAAPQPQKKTVRKPKAAAKEKEDASVAAQPPKKAVKQSKVAGKEKDDASVPSQPSKKTAKQTNAAKKEKEAIANPSVSASTGKKQTAREKHEAEMAAEQKAIDEKMASPEGLEYRCMSRPWEDRQREWRDDEDMDEEPDEKEMERCNEENKKYMDTAPDEAPEWPWIATKMGIYLVNEYTDQAQRRDQDNFSMYIYNDFTGYGLQEVVENQLFAFNEEYTKKDCDPHRVFVHMEAMAIWLFTSQLYGWVGLDDGERFSATVAVAGRALLTALNSLERADLLKPDSKVKNIPMVLSMFLAFADDMDDTGALEQDIFSMGKTQTWPNSVVAYAKAHDIDLKGKGVYGTEEIVDKFDDMEVGDFKRKPGPDRWGFNPMFKAFTSLWAAPSGNKKKRIGGETFDIIKMKPSERKKYAFDGKDPLDRLDPDRLVH